MSNVLTGLRAIAAELGVSRKKLARFIEQGLPITRQGERIHADIEEARAWIAINEDFIDESEKLAPVLHPDDPRYRERTAAAAIGEMELARQRGELLLRANVHRVTADRIATMRGVLSFLSRYFGAEIGTATGAEVAAALKPTIAAIVEPFTNFPWPEPTAAPSPEYDFEGGERETLPRLASGDPRYDFAVVRMQQRERELAALKASLAPRELVRTVYAGAGSIVRKHVDSIPAKVAKKIGLKPVNRDMINDVVDTIGHETLWALHADFQKMEKAA